MKFIGKYFAAFIGVISGIIGIFAPLTNVSIKEINHNLFPVVVALAIICIIFVIRDAIVQRRLIQFEGYSRAYKNISLGFSQLHELSRPGIGLVTQKDILKKMEGLCSSLADGFKLITGYSEISVCIKIMAEDANDRIHLFTFCRDNRNQILRPTGEAEEKKHYLNENTDFELIKQKLRDPNGDFFLSNNLCWKREYINSRLPDDWHTMSSINRLYKRIFDWPLKYKSTIVVPILPLDATNRGYAQLVGFVCIDGPKPFLFKKRYDVDILRGVADGIFNTVQPIARVH